MKREGHLTPSECGQIASDMGCNRLLLTHSYPEVLETDILSIVKKKFEGEAILATDGMKLEI